MIEAAQNSGVTKSLHVGLNNTVVVIQFHSLTLNNQFKPIPPPSHSLAILSLISFRMSIEMLNTIDFEIHWDLNGKLIHLIQKL
jgi:hypothetical protein